MYWQPLPQLNGYPLDLDGGEKITRFRTGVSPRPYPPIIGCLSGFLPFQDALGQSLKRARAPMGPGVTTVPVNLAWQITMPGLSKTG